MKVLVRQRDLSDDYLRFAVQIGADGIDIHNAEVGLDDGDMNMFAVLETLREVGFNGGLQMDHLPHYDDDDGQRSATAFAVGYTKALLRALDR